MSRVFHTSDWHIGHKAILKYRPEFSSVEEHDNTIFNNYKNLIRKRDTCWFHGDIAFSLEALEKVAGLPGYKILVMGNHDTDFYREEHLFTAFDRVYSLKSKKGAWLSHAPIHPDELRGKINIHGHTHYHSIKDSRYFNVCVEQTNYTPINRQEINLRINDETSRK